MTTTSAHPHDPYIDAVIAALTAADLEPDESWTDDGESRGMYCYLNAVITLDPDGVLGEDSEEVPAGVRWPYGLLLVWEWHPGLEEGEAERGPVWLHAALKADGSNEYPSDLPVYGYASPEAVVEAARKVIAREINASRTEIIGGSWDGADELNAACEAWGTEEADS